jgi:hypothetical protein
MGKINIFKPEDFLGTCGARASLSRELCAQVANTKLQALIEAATTVYGYGETPMASSLWNMNGPETERSAHTHQARLMFIEKLPVKECVHEGFSVETPTLLVDWSSTGQIIPSRTVMKTNFRCKHCGVELKAKWEAVK